MKKTVLIIHTDRKLASRVHRQCRSLGLVAKTVHAAVDAFAIMDERLPDLVCMDPELETGHALSIAEMMATDPDAARIPLILLTERIHETLLRKTTGMCAYFLRPSRNLERRLEAVVYELVDVDGPARSVRGSTAPSQTPSRTERESP